MQRVDFDRVGNGPVHLRLFARCRFGRSRSTPYVLTGVVFIFIFICIVVVDASPSLASLRL